MQKPGKRLRRTLERATANYETSLSLAASYLLARGIELETAVAARLGVVVSPEPGHEPFLSRLCIPYVDVKGVYGLKFRCLTHDDCKSEGCPKYLALPGQEVSMYGVVDADSTMPTIHIAEGELDRLVLKQVFAGEPAVGIPGVQTWLPHHSFHFSGFERVIMWPDGDKAGADLANRIRKDVRGMETMPIPSGFDVSSFYMAYGADALRAMAGVDEDDE